MEAADLLKQSALFAELSADDVSKLSPSTREETYHSGHVILREGRVGTAFYLIVSGQVEVVHGIGSAGPKVVAMLGPGDFFGEIAVLKHVTRTASVRAATETVCLVIHRLDLDSFIERYPAITAKVQSALFTRFGSVG